MEDDKSSDLADISAEIDPDRKKIASEADSAEGEKDEDRHFLLWLLSEIRKGPAERKLKLLSDIISVIVTAQRPDHQQWPSQGGSFAPYPFQHPTQYTPSSSYPSSIIPQRVPSQQDHLHRFSRLQALQNMPNPQQTSMSPSPNLSTDSPAQTESEYVIFE
ncbi:hypothetical protein AVEN_33955-1 [Araneus ventricosus]|uniref:BESS domain-containing protein n=1 Tax=Araneus ventricosus TaxID=182803 RepID=A0A4Y2FM55_ARAVE|nr:hypothetical protein AVEN_33955-1 [Araneus ventricosus]